jgi:hypothetical protein
MTKFPDVEFSPAMVIALVTLVNNISAALNYTPEQAVQFMFETIVALEFSKRFTI